MEEANGPGTNIEKSTTRTPSSGSHGSAIYFNPALARFAARRSRLLAVSTTKRTCRPRPHVSIDHLAATPLGLKVTIDAKIVEVDRRRVTFEFSVRDPIEECGRGSHVRFVVETAKSRERLAAKRAKAGLA